MEINCFSASIFLFLFSYSNINSMDIFDDLVNDKDEAKDLIASFFSIGILPIGFTLSNADESIRHEVNWKYVTEIYFTDRNEAVQIKLSNGKELRIASDYSNWPQFLKAVPHRYAEFDRQVVTKIFATLQGCKACGLIAVHAEICEYCGTGVYDPEMDEEEFGNETEYYREHQLANFDGAIEPDSNTCFSIDKEWKALITEEDLE
jgi:hypothetical protein